MPWHAGRGSRWGTGLTLSEIRRGVQRGPVCQKGSWGNNVERRFTPLRPPPPRTVPCGKRETGPRVSFSQLITIVCLSSTTVLYLQELWARFAVCGFPSLWGSTCRG